MIEVPSPLADAMIGHARARDELYEAELTGDRDLIVRKLAEYQAAERRRRELTPSP